MRETFRGRLDAARRKPVAIPAGSGGQRRERHYVQGKVHRNTAQDGQPTPSATLRPGEDQPTPNQTPRATAGVLATGAVYPEGSNTEGCPKGGGINPPPQGERHPTNITDPHTGKGWNLVR